MMTVRKMSLSFAVALLFASFHVIAAEAPKKYRRLVITPLPASDANPSAQKTRSVKLDASIVPGKPASPEASQQNVYLELFGDARFKTSLQQSCSQDGCSWVGTIDKQPGSTVIILRRDASSLVANVRDAKGRTFQISPQKTNTGSSTSGRHVILRAPPISFPDERSPTAVPQAPLPPPRSEDAPPRAASDRRHRRGTKAPAHPSDEVAQLDVLVLYTQNAKSVIEGPAAQAQGTKKIEEEILLAAKAANQSFDNSDIKIKLNVVAIQQVDYREVTVGDPFAAALNSLSEAEGALKNVFELKKKYKAHLVSLWIAEKPDTTTPTSCGLGNVLETRDKSFGQYAFSVVHALCGLANFSFAHEIGHNLGAQHNREVEVDPSSRAYNFGYIPPSRKFRCVMSYACASVTSEAPCIRQPIWSNPKHSWLGEKAGIEAGSEGAADNARELNENRFLAADYWRPDSGGGSPDTPTEVPSYLPSDNTYTLTNASRNGTEECLIMGANGHATYPSRHLWGGRADGFCGLGSDDELLANKQAIWKLKPLGNDKYVIINASRDGTEECLIMSGNGQERYPRRYLWGGGPNGFCGLSSVAELLANKQAVWTLKPLGNNKYVIANASRDGTTEECLIMSGNGQEAYPSRYLWGAGQNGFCGLASNAELLANKQAVWTLQVRKGAARYTITNASRNGTTEECLIMGGNGQAEFPSRYLWGGGANGHCGMWSNAELLGNEQAVWTLKPLGNDKYVITNASRNGTEECLIISGNGKAEYPSRYLWGGGANGFCGLASNAELLANKQAVWTLKPLGNNKYVLTNASRNGTEECLIMSGNGQEAYPRRYLWGGGANGFCGLGSKEELLANKQAVWTFTPIP